MESIPGPKAQQKLARKIIGCVNDYFDLGIVRDFCSRLLCGLVCFLSFFLTLPWWACKIDFGKE